MVSMISVINWVTRIIRSESNLVRRLNSNGSMDIIDGRGLLVVIGKFMVFFVNLLWLECNCIYIAKLFTINCWSGTYMRCGVQMLQLETDPKNP